LGGSFLHPRSSGFTRNIRAVSLIGHIYISRCEICQIYVYQIYVWHMYIYIFIMCIYIYIYKMCIYIMYIYIYILFWPWMAVSKVMGVHPNHPKIRLWLGFFNPWWLGDPSWLKKPYHIIKSYRLLWYLYPCSIHIPFIFHRGGIFRWPLELGLWVDGNLPEKSPNIWKGHPAGRGLVVSEVDASNLVNWGL
jgi:hypothetical protein